MARDVIRPSSLTHIILDQMPLMVWIACHDSPDASALPPYCFLSLYGSSICFLVT